MESGHMAASTNFGTGTVNAGRSLDRVDTVRLVTERRLAPGPLGTSDRIGNHPVAVEARDARIALGQSPCNARPAVWGQC